MYPAHSRCCCLLCCSQYWCVKECNQKLLTDIHTHKHWLQHAYAYMFTASIARVCHVAGIVWETHPHCKHVLADLQDATQLALKIVTNYALSDSGITTYASPGQSLGFMRKSFEVSHFQQATWHDKSLLHC